MPKLIKSEKKFGNKVFALLHAPSLLSGADFQAIRNDRKALEYAQKWNADLFSVPMVNITKDGAGIITDGQHRIYAYCTRLENGEETEEYIVCEITKNKTLSEQAGLYTNFATCRRKPTPMETFRGRMVEGEIVTTFINDSIEKFGLNVPWERNSVENERSITCVSTLYNIYKQTKDKFPHFMKIVTDAYQDKNTKVINRLALQSEFLSGLLSYIKNPYLRNLEDSPRYISERLKTQCPEAIVKQAYSNQSEKHNKRNSRTINKEVALVIHEIMK